MDTDHERTVFGIGDPVLVVTDRPLTGCVTGLGDILHIGVIDLAPQSFEGQKGWVFSLMGPAGGGDPTGYDVGFQLQGSPRAVVVHQFLGGAGVVSEERQLDRGTGHVGGLRLEDLTPDPAPEGTFDALLDEMYAAGEFDLDPTDVLSEAERLLDARQAALDPESYLARRDAVLSELSTGQPEIFQKSLENDQAKWRRFQEGCWPSITAYITRYIESEDAGRLDWTAILSAIEQAEQGDRAAFEAFLEDVYVEGQGVLSLGTGRPDPGVPTTACFDCDAVVPVSDTYVSKRGLALCEPCFLKRQAKGRARRRRQPFARE